MSNGIETQGVQLLVGSIISCHLFPHHLHLFSPLPSPEKWITSYTSHAYFTPKVNCGTKIRGGKERRKKGQNRPKEEKEIDSSILRRDRDIASSGSSTRRARWLPVLDSPTFNFSFFGQYIYLFGCITVNTI